MKSSTKVLVYGLLSAFALSAFCIYANMDSFLEEERQEAVKISTISSEETQNPKVVIPSAPSQSFTNVEEKKEFEPSSLIYMINNSEITIDGKLPILESNDDLKQSLMQHCEQFQCFRKVIFVKEQSYPVWSEFAQKMISFFHDENLSSVGMSIDEKNRVILTGELLDGEVQQRLKTLIQTYGIAYDVNDSTSVKVEEVIVEEEPSIPQEVLEISTDGTSKLKVTIPVDPVEEAQSKISTVLETEHIQFAYNRAKITSKSKQTLKKIIQMLKEVQGQDILIEVNGYTDASGKRSINKWISQERAKSVKNYLGSHGLNPRDIKAKGYGETNLLYPDKPYSQLNRRVEIVIKRR